MECNNDFRHVCYKDLKNYIERDKYFSDFTKEEIELTQQNIIKTLLPFNSSKILIHSGSLPQQKSPRI